MQNERDKELLDTPLYKRIVQEQLNKEVGKDLGIFDKFGKAFYFIGGAAAVTSCLPTKPVAEAAAASPNENQNIFTPTPKPTVVPFQPAVPDLRSTFCETCDYDSMARQKNQRPASNPNVLPSPVASQSPDQVKLPSHYEEVWGNLQIYDAPDGKYLGYVIPENIVGKQIEILEWRNGWVRVKFSVVTKNGNIERTCWITENFGYGERPTQKTELPKLVTDVLGSRPPQTDELKKVKPWGVEGDPPLSGVTIYGDNEYYTISSLSLVVLTKAYDLGDGTIELHFKFNHPKGGLFSSASCNDCKVLYKGKSTDQIFGIAYLGGQGQIQRASISELVSGTLLALRINFVGNRNQVTTSFQALIIDETKVWFVYTDPRSGLAGTATDANLLGAQ